MSQEIGNKDFEAYMNAWATMMLTIWREKMVLLNVNDTFELNNSFVSDVYIHAGGDGAKVDFAFRQYGFYVNEGVGGEFTVGNDGDLIDSAHYNLAKGTFNLTREPKPWFDLGWFKSIHALRRDVARLYGEKLAKNIVFHLKPKS